MARRRAQTKSGIQSFVSHIQIRPHGDRLLTSGAAFWLFAAQVLVFAMAGAEAVAWGYLGYLFGTGWVKWAVAGATGIIIFFVVWMIDVSLLTLDRSSNEHAERIFGEKNSDRARNARTYFAILTRIIVVVASLTITAPYLSQLVFHKDIGQWIKEQAVGEIDEARMALKQDHDENIEEKNREIEEKRNKYEKEVAGGGVSGRYGIGPAAQAIQTSIDTLQQERDLLKEEYEAQISEFDQDIVDWEGKRDFLSAKYDLSLPQASILANREALEALRSRPEHKQTELAIKAFLAFIFIGLLLLKLFEPRSIRLYLSEVLQQEYDRYLAGSFDGLLPDTEKSTSDQSAMPPQRLYDFLVHVWSKKRSSEARQSETLERQQAARADIATLEDMLVKAHPMLEYARQEVEDDRQRWEEAEARYQQLLGAIDLVQGHVSKFSSERKALEKGIDTLDEWGTAEYGSRIRAKLSKAEHKLNGLMNAKQHEERKLRRTQEALAEAEEALKLRREEYRRIEEKILEARSAMLVSDHLRPIGGSSSQEDTWSH